MFTTTVHTLFYFLHDEIIISSFSQFFDYVLLMKSHSITQDIARRYNCDVTSIKKSDIQSATYGFDSLPFFTTDRVIIYIPVCNIDMKS